MFVELVWIYFLLQLAREGIGASCDFGWSDGPVRTYNFFFLQTSFNI